MSNSDHFWVFDDGSPFELTVEDRKRIAAIVQQSTEERIRIEHEFRRLEERLVNEQFQLIRKKYTTLP